MEQRELKFRSAHYNFDGTFNGFTYWGLLDTVDVETVSCFTSPTCRRGTHRKVEEQYTGFNDMNDKEIYEGDIIEYTQALFNVSEEKYHKKTKVVKWDITNLSWNIFETKAGEYNFEILGNIHQNPELLKGDQQNG